MRFSKQHRKGVEGTFYGYDGKQYDATIVDVRNGIASLEYHVVGRGMVTARLSAQQLRDRFTIAEWISFR